MHQYKQPLPIPELLGLKEGADYHLSVAVKVEEAHEVPLHAVPVHVDVPEHGTRRHHSTAIEPHLRRVAADEPREGGRMWG